MFLFRKKKLNMVKNEKGMVTVEVLLSFFVFVLFTAALINIANIFIVHNRIQFAMNSVAHQLSSYGYLYEAFGVKDADAQFKKDFGGDAENIDSTVNSVVDTVNKTQTFLASGSQAISDLGDFSLDSSYFDTLESDLNDLENKGSDALEQGKDSLSKIEERFNDPKGSAAGVVYLLANAAEREIKGAVGSIAAKTLVKNYICQGSKDADAYLKGYGVVGGYDGLDFSGSSLFADTDNQLIDIVVTYKLKVYLFDVFLKDKGVTVVQRVTVPAWLDGDGRSVATYLK